MGPLAEPSYLHHFSIKFRLAAAFAFLAMLSGCQGFVSIRNFTQAEASLRHLRDIQLPAIVAINQIQDATSEVRIKQYRMIGLFDSPQELAINIHNYQVARNTMLSAIRNYEPVIDDIGKRGFAMYLANWRKYEIISDEIFTTLTEKKKPHDAMTLVANELPLYDNMRNELSNLVADSNKQALQLTAISTAAAASTVKFAWLCMSLAVCASLIMMLLSFKSVSNPIAFLTATMKNFASGNMQSDVPFLSRKDEIGAMAKAVEVFKTSMIRNLALETESGFTRAKLAMERRRVMLEIADQFEVIVRDVVDGAAARANDMQSTAKDLSLAASETARRSATVAMAAKETEGSALTVANAARDLGQSVFKVHQQVDGSADLAKIAVLESQHAETLIQDLHNAASKIGDIISLISAIADQTNLLALNATIEAAVAGSGGRGFKVVAFEVKALANKTSRATGEIGEQISRIQESTKEAVAAIHLIGQRIAQVSTLAVTIAEAVDDQDAATQGIVHSIQDAANGTRQVTGNISYVVDAAYATGSAAQRVFDMATDLAAQSQFLRAEVDRFLSEVRAA